MKFTLGMAAAALAVLGLAASASGASARSGGKRTIHRQGNVRNDEKDANRDEDRDAKKDEERGRKVSEHRRDSHGRGRR